MKRDGPEERSIARLVIDRPFPTDGRGEVTRGRSPDQVVRIDIEREAVAAEKEGIGEMGAVGVEDLAGAGDRTEGDHVGPPVLFGGGGRKVGGRWAETVVSALGETTAFGADEVVGLC